MLLIHVINQTAGLFGGDSVITHVIVEPEARVLLSSPSAARFHPSHKREVRLEQNFEIRPGGFLDVFPEISIPQRNSRTFQKTVIRLEPGGEMLYLEQFAPGRVASGETFAWTRYAWHTDILLADTTVHRERAVLIPNGPGMPGLTALFPASYYANLVLISPISESWKADFAYSIVALGDDHSLKIAASKLGRGGWSIRLLAADGVALRQGVDQLRQTVYRQLGRSPPNPRRS